MKRTRFPALLAGLFFLSTLLGCGGGGDARSAEGGGETPREHARAEQPTGTGGRAAIGTPLVTAAGLKIAAPPTWAIEAPASTMRVAQFSILGEGGEPEPGEIAVFHFGPGGGGDVQANLERWAGQFHQEDGTDPMTKAVTEKKNVGELTITTIELPGHYKTQAMPGAVGSYDEEGWRLLGAVVEGPGGPWFIKAVGPDKLMASQRGAFHTMLEGLTLAG